MLGYLITLLNPTTILVFILVLLLTHYALNTPRFLNMPPGPFPLPVLGNFHQVAKRPGPGHFHIFQTLAAKHGKIFSLKFGSLNTIVISDYKTLMDVFVKKANIFSDRPVDNLYVLKHLNDRVGPGFVNGQHWKILRRTALSTMRDFGVGKQSLEEKIQEEVRVLLDVFSQQKDQPIYTRPIFNMATSNVICQVIFGSRFDYEDETFKELMRVVEMALNSNPFVVPINFFPFLKHIPYFRDQAEIFCTTTKITLDYVQTLAANNESTFDPENIRDFVDLFIKMRREHKDDDEAFDAKSMARVISDLFTTGSDTTANSLSWGLLYMAKYREIQGKCQKEIDEVIGRGKMLSWLDRERLPYVEATVLEILRIRPAAPTGVPHCANSDAEVQGYHIPKNTIVFSNLISMNMDPETFPNPEIFDPGHFLDKDGKKVTNRECLMTFSIGPRACLGEILAKMEMSLFFTTILQFFTLSPEPGKPIDLSPTDDFILRHKEQNIVFTSRD